MLLATFSMANPLVRTLDSMTAQEQEEFFADCTSPEVVQYTRLEAVLIPLVEEGISTALELAAVLRAGQAGSPVFCRKWTAWWENNLQVWDLFVSAPSCVPGNPTHGMERPDPLQVEPEIYMLCSK